MTTSELTQPETIREDSIANMTRAELRALIDEMLREHQTRSTSYTVVPERPLDEILDAIWAIRFTLPPGAKSSVELLREDRDR
jgi:hypothetical protein